MPLAPSSFAHREVVAPVGLWERGAGASGYIPPSARLFPKLKILPRQNRREDLAREGRSTPFSLAWLILAPATIVRNGRLHRASKADATSPSGETRPLGGLVVSEGTL